MNRIILFMFLAFGVINSQTFRFLNLETSPRAAALGGTFVANTNDVNVMFYNPAGIAKLTATPVSTSYLMHLEEINSAYVVGSRFFEGYGRFAASVQYVNYGTFTKADEYGNQTGEFGASDLAIAAGYGNELGENFYYGISLKFIYSGIDSYSSTAIASDLGLMYILPETKWSFGFSVLNLGTQLTSYISETEKLPLNVRLGFSKQLEHLPLTFYASLNKINETNDEFSQIFDRWTLGGEFRFSQSVSLRVGYDNEKRNELSLGESAGLAGFNVGFGVFVKLYQVDYAFSSFGPVGSVHRFGISTSF